MMQQLALPHTLDELEAVIERGLSTFIEVGSALMKIRDERLYKERGYTRFDTYCRERWGPKGISYQHAYRLITASTIAQQVSPMGETPTSERQTRPLTAIKVETSDGEEDEQATAAARAAVWTEAVEAAESEGRKVTAKDVQEAVQRRHDPAYSSTPTTGVSASAEYDSDEWYTPIRYVEAARQVMGAIDLDPASCEHAQQSIRAGAFYTKDMDGLSQPWFGRVWLNPPYSQPTASNFARRLLSDYLDGKIDAAVMVQNASTDTGWFHEVAVHAHLCLTRGRINFDRYDGESSANRYGQVFFYLGEDGDEFERVFSEFGLTGRLRGPV